MLYMALSCLQGWPMRAAATELLDAGAQGLQLTPGCVPTPAFGRWLDHLGVRQRRHDGFSWRGLRQPVWDSDGRTLVSAESVHPPRQRPDDDFVDWLDRAAVCGSAVEVMYPGHWLGTGTELEAAMDHDLVLAVDVSHLYIQQQAGVLSPTQLDRVLSYGRVAEVHVSANDGRRDLHRQVTADSFWLGWARERYGDGVPVVCESYLQRISSDERHAFVEELHTWMGAV